MDYGKDRRDRCKTGELRRALIFLGRVLRRRHLIWRSRPPACPITPPPHPNLIPIPTSWIMVMKDSCLHAVRLPLGQVLNRQQHSLQHVHGIPQILENWRNYLPCSAAETSRDCLFAFFSIFLQPFFGNYIPPRKFLLLCCCTALGAGSFYRQNVGIFPS